MLPARPNALYRLWFDWWTRRALRQQFAHVYFYGQRHFADGFDAKRSSLLIANHSSFWDGLLVYHLLRRFRRQPIYCMIDQRQVEKHPFFRRVGGFSVDRGSGRDGIRAIDYAANLLNKSPCALLIFPQGQVEPIDRRPIAFERGAAHLIQRCADCDVRVLAIRYDFWAEQRGEALLRMSDPLALKDEPRATIVTTLRQTLESEMDQLATDSKMQKPGQHILLRGVPSVADWTWWRR